MNTAITPNPIIPIANSNAMNRIEEKNHIRDTSSIRMANHLFPTNVFEKSQRKLSVQRYKCSRNIKNYTSRNSIVRNRINYNTIDRKPLKSCIDNPIYPTNFTYRSNDTCENNKVNKI